MERLDLARLTIRELNHYLHHELPKNGVNEIEIINPNGLHSIAVGLTVPVRIKVLGHAGYFLAGMNQRAEVTVQGNVGWSVAENMMSGTVRVKGFASECAGASAHGGLLVIEGSASSRCGISMKGVDIVVGEDVGHMSAFMAQAGRLVICGDAGAGLGDSLYEAVIYIRGKIHSLGADAREEPMSEKDYATVSELLHQADINYSAREFKRVASGRTLYHWNAEAGQEY
jgi:methylamine---glutamate N-methyltransferase subunit B